MRLPSINHRLRSLPSAQIAGIRVLPLLLSLLVATRLSGLLTRTYRYHAEARLRSMSSSSSSPLHLIATPWSSPSPNQTVSALDELMVSIAASFTPEHVVDDFNASASIEGGASTANTSFSLASPLPVTALAPSTFASLRNAFGVSPLSHAKRLSSGFTTFASNSKGAARAGTSFFFSSDGAYLLKTIPERERSALLKMLPEYARYMKSRGGKDSLLTRFCGMYDVGTGSSRQTVVVMNSVFPPGSVIDVKYDLKGSTVGRRATKEEVAKGRSAVLKDLDLKEDVDSELCDERVYAGGGWGLNVGSSKKADLMKQLSRDVEFLKLQGVMDYSLLVGIRVLQHKRQKRKLYKVGRGRLSSSESDETLRRKVSRAMIRIPGKLLRKTAKLSLGATKTVFLGSADLNPKRSMSIPTGPLSILQGKHHGDPALYYFGVIDFLQPWSMRKVAEVSALIPFRSSHLYCKRKLTLQHASSTSISSSQRQLKGLTGFDVKAISCADPSFYADRLLAFIDSNST